ncbi:hypothetical protein CRENBAI_015026 [Crenichthys baileyi]|uniref:Acyl-CoA oxidase C-terminal domain-containing protein n=1 Tax=Crenichthys baileyi TaxID=28760 RepID=A0AAV9SRZ4_9TELE
MLCCEASSDSGCGPGLPQNQLLCLVKSVIGRTENLSLQSLLHFWRHVCVTSIDIFIAPICGAMNHSLHHHLHHSQQPQSIPLKSIPHHSIPLHQRIHFHENSLLLSPEPRTLLDSPEPWSWPQAAPLSSLDQVFPQRQPTSPTYKWLVCFLLDESAKRLEQHRASGKDEFEARNSSQVYYCRSLAIAFIEHSCLQRFHEVSNNAATPTSLKPVLKKLCALYGLWSLTSHMATLFQGIYLTGNKPVEFIQMAILTLCSELKDDAVALVDVIAPTDFILNSPIGNADGQHYKGMIIPLSV